MAAEAIKSFLPDLVTAISDIVQPVSDQCLAKGLIPESVHKRVLESGGTSDDKARTLILAVKKSLESDSNCSEILLAILEEQLPYAIKEKVLSGIKKEITKKAKAKVTSSQNIELVQSVQSPQENATLHTKLLGKFEESIRRHERACAEKNLLQQRLKTKSEKYEKLKHELEVLKNQNEKTSSVRDDMDRAQSRISACENGISNLKTRIKELEETIEEQDMQARRSQNVVTIQTKNIFTLFAQKVENAARERDAVTRQKADEQMKMKELQHKLEIQEKELRIKELRVKSTQQEDINPSDILKPANLSRLTAFIRGKQGILLDAHTLKWADLGSKLGFSMPRNG